MSQKPTTSASCIKNIVSLIDLTNLNDECDDLAIKSLCEQASTPLGNVAAVCIWPQWVASAKKYLTDISSATNAAANAGANARIIEVATVVNFPKGNSDLIKTCSLIETCISHGATEIDYVLPYTDFINGEMVKVTEALKTIRKHIPNTIKLKVILETGVLSSNENIKAAAHIAIDQGADFIKTSTGKVPVNATPAAAKIMLDAIAQSKHDIGFKAAGGIKTVEEATVFLNLAEERFNSAWLDATHFRFGASSLLQNALAEAGVTDNHTSKADYNY